jgi:hypothetical protein
MEKELLEFTKKQKISNSKDNKQKTLKVINRTIKKRMSANIAQHYNTFTQKKIARKSLFDKLEKKSIKINSLYTQEDKNEYNLKLDKKFLSTLFNYNFDNSLDPPDLKNETVLNFQKYSCFSVYPTDINKKPNNKKKEGFSPLFQYGTQFIINDMHKSLNNTIDSVIKLQSYLRGYLVKKKLIINNLDKSYFEKKSIKAIIKIQKNIRGFLSRVNIRKKIIIKYIYQKRKFAIELIIKRMKIYTNVIKIKKMLFISYHLEQRKKKAIYIQETYRNYKFYKSFKKLKKEIDNSYFLYYPYKAKKVEIIIYFDDDTNTKKESRKYSFVYNKLLKYSILLINPSKIFSGKYKCQFVVNDIIVCDNRYPYIQHNNGFFNVIHLIQKNKNLKSTIKPTTTTKKIISKKKKLKKINDCINEVKIIGARLNRKKLIQRNKPKGYLHLNNSSNFYLENLRLSLEDIKEEDDEGKSVTSKDNRYDKKLKDSIKESLCDKSLNASKENEKKIEKEKNEDEEDDVFDFTEEEYLEIKRIKNKNIENQNYLKLKDELNDAMPINKLEKIRKSSLKTINKNK